MLIIIDLVEEILTGVANGAQIPQRRSTYIIVVTGYRHSV